MGSTDQIHFSFDLDGTLINSLPLMEKSWNNVRDQLSINVEWSEYKKHIGYSFRDICSKLNLSEFEEEIRNEYFGFNAKNQDLITAMPGLDDLRIILNKASSWSVITSKPSVTALPILENFDLKPNQVITPDVVRRGKPYVDSANYLKNHYGLNYQYYYVGDMIVDHLFAINSDLKFIRFSSSEKLNTEMLDIYNYILNKHECFFNLTDLADFLGGIIEKHK